VPLLSWAVKIIGVAYLLWLAFKISQSRQLSQADAARLNVTFWQGAALQFVNIKAWMLALAIVSGWIAGREAPGLRLAIVLPVMLAYAFVSNLTYALAGSLLRDWLRARPAAACGCAGSTTSWRPCWWPLRSGCSSYEPQRTDHQRPVAGPAGHRDLLGHAADDAPGRGHARGAADVGPFHRAGPRRGGRGPVGGVPAGHPRALSAA
jgi:hypothetical protein